MKKKNYLLILFLLLNLSLFAQIGPILNNSVYETFLERAEQRVENFYSDLNLIGGDDINNEERTLIISQLLNSLFSDKQIYVFNDIDLTGKQPIFVESGTYLNNIKLYFSNSDVSFRIDSLKLSDVFINEDLSFYFIKAEVQREMTVTLDNRQIRNTSNLDLYLKFVPNLVDCKLYGIKKHEENLGDFKKVKIIKDNFGSILINSIPNGAIVTINQLPQFRTFTPDTIKNLQPGFYNLTLTKDGKTEKRDIKVEPGKLNELNVVFTGIEEPLGSYRLNTDPIGANVTINNNLIPNAKTPYTINNHEPGIFDIEFSKKGYNSLRRQIEIEPNKTGTLNVSLQKIASNAGKGQMIWLGGAIATAAAGGYFMITADKNFKDYQKSTDSDEAADLKKKVQLYDKLTVGGFGLAGICTVGFTISTVKKGKAKTNYAHVEMNGQGARLTYNF